MKVVHLVSSRSGGATRAAERISCAQKKHGIDSEVLYKSNVHNRFPQFIYRVLNVLSRYVFKGRYIKMFSSHWIGRDLI